MTTTPKPTVGRIVHYQHPAGGEPLAAVVTSIVSDDEVTLTIFMPQQLPGYMNQPIRYAETPTPGCWSWPPRA